MHTPAREQDGQDVNEARREGEKWRLLFGDVADVDDETDGEAKIILPQVEEAGHHVVAFGAARKQARPAQQENSQTEFSAHGNGYAIFLRPGEATLALKHAQEPAILRMTLAGAEENPLIAGDELPG